MLLGVAQKLSQFGQGFQPVRETSWTENADTTEGALTALEQFLSQLIGLITVIGSIFFIIYFLLGALNWITAAGDSGKIQKAREQMMQSALGLVIVVAAYGVIGLVGAVVGINILQPAQMLRELIPG